MRKRLTQALTSITKEVPDDIQDYWKVNFTTLFDEMLGMTAGTVSSGKLINNTTDIEIVAGFYPNGQGDFAEVLTNQNISATLNDGSYELFLVEATITDLPAPIIELLDTSTRSQTVITADKRELIEGTPQIAVNTTIASLGVTNDVFDVVNSQGLASGDTISVDGTNYIIDTIVTNTITLTTVPPSAFLVGDTVNKVIANSFKIADFTISSNNVASLTPTLAFFGNLENYSLQSFADNNKAEVIESGQVSGRILDKTGDTTWLKIELNNSYTTGRGIVIDTGTNGGAKGITVNASSNTALEINNGNLVLNTGNFTLNTSNLTHTNGNINLNTLTAINITDSPIIGTSADNDTFLNITGTGVTDTGINVSGYNTGIQLNTDDNKVGLNIIGTGTGDIGISTSNLETAISIDITNGDGINITSTATNSNNGITVNVSDNSNSIVVQGGNNGISINGVSNNGVLVSGAGDNAIEITGYTNRGVFVNSSGTGNDKTSFYASYGGDSANANSIGFFARESRVGFKFDKDYDSLGTPIGLSITGINVTPAPSNITDWRTNFRDDAKVYGIIANYTNVGFRNQYSNVVLEAVNYSEALIRPTVLSASEVAGISSPSLGDIIVRDDSGVKLAIWNGSSWVNCNP